MILFSVGGTFLIYAINYLLVQRQRKAITRILEQWCPKLF